MVSLLTWRASWLVGHGRVAHIFNPAGVNLPQDDLLLFYAAGGCPGGVFLSGIRGTSDRQAKHGAGINK